MDEIREVQLHNFEEHKRIIAKCYEDTGSGPHARYFLEAGEDLYSIEYDDGEMFKPFIQKLIETQGVTHSTLVGMAKTKKCTGKSIEEALENVVNIPSEECAMVICEAIGYTPLMAVAKVLENGTLGAFETLKGTGHSGMLVLDREEVIH